MRLILIRFLSSPRMQKWGDKHGVRILWGAFASFFLQAFAAPFGLFPPWVGVIGMAPLVLIILVAATSLIWAREVWFPPEEDA